MLIALKHLLRRPLRSVSIALGVCLGAATYMVLVAAGRSLVDQFLESARVLGAEVVVHEREVTSPWGSWLSNELVHDLVAIEGVAGASPVALGKTRLRETSYFLVFGVASDNPGLARLALADGSRLFTEDTRHHMLLGRHAARRLGLGINHTLELRGIQFRVTGIFDSGSSVVDNGAIIELGITQTLFNLRDGVNLVFLDLEDGVSEQTMVERIDARFAGVSAASTTGWVDSYGQGRLVEAFARFLGLFAILIVSLSEANVLQMSVSERLQDLAILRAIGWSRLRVAGQVLGEGWLVTAVGGLGAIPLSNVLLWAFSTIDPATFNSAGVLPASLPWSVAAEGLIVSLLAGLVGSLGPLVRALRLDPARALRAL